MQTHTAQAQAYARASQARVVPTVWNRRERFRICPCLSPGKYLFTGARDVADRNRRVLRTRVVGCFSRTSYWLATRYENHSASKKTTTQL